MVGGVGALGGGIEPGAREGWSQRSTEVSPVSHLNDM